MWLYVCPWLVAGMQKPLSYLWARPERSNTAWSNLTHGCAQGLAILELTRNLFPQVALRHVGSSNVIVAISKLGF